MILFIPKMEWHLSSRELCPSNSNSPLASFGFDSLCIGETPLTHVGCTHAGQTLGRLE
jgi:hypothetical protein